MGLEPPEGVEGLRAERVRLLDPQEVEVVANRRGDDGGVDRLAVDGQAETVEHARDDGEAPALVRTVEDGHGRQRDHVVAELAEHAQTLLAAAVRREVADVEDAHGRTQPARRRVDSLGSSRAAE
ncbi:MAG: hypothetical protein R3F34_09970 [Planctomycetota bacterium]